MYIFLKLIVLCNKNKTKRTIIPRKYTREKQTKGRAWKNDGKYLVLKEKPKEKSKNDLQTQIQKNITMAAFTNCSFFNSFFLYKN